MSVKPTWEIIWIDNQEQLEEACQKLLKEDIISIDTETIGWQSGNEQLCLIQIGAPSEEKVYLIDSLKITKLDALIPVLSEPLPNLIAHNAPFEERQFKRYGIKMRGVVDTLKLAYQLRSDLPSKSLKSCCKFILDIDLSKEEQSSDWGHRPLSQSQIDYAALDAEITYKLYQVFAEMQQKLIVDNQSTMPELMKDLYESEREIFNLTKNIAAELEFMRLRKENLKATIRNKLIEGEPPYEGVYGKALVQTIKRTEINPVKVRELMPEIAEEVIKESVPLENFRNITKMHNIDKKLIDEATNFVKNEYRLKLELGDF